MNHSGKIKKLYKNQFMEKLLHDNLIEKTQKEIEQKMIEGRHQKRYHYDKIVKEMHYPEVSPSKQRQIESLKRTVKSRFNVTRESEAKPKRSGSKPRSTRKSSFKDYEVLSRETKTKSQARSPNDDSTEGSVYNNGKRTVLKRKKIDWAKFKNPLVPKPKLKKPQPEVEDYLQQKRMKREEMEQELTTPPMKNKYGVLWQDITTDLLDEPSKLVILSLQFL